MFIFNPRNYSDSEIDAVLHIKDRTQRVTFRYDLLDRNDVKIGELDGIEDAKVSYGEFRTIKRSATFELNEYSQKNIDYMSDQIQPWFILHMPQGGTVEYPLGIFLLESPERQINGRFTSRNIGAYDKSLIIEGDRFTERFFIAAGTNYVGVIIKILTLSGISKISITSNSSVIRSDREIPIGAKVKEVVNNLLGEINYRSISVNEVGFFLSEPYVEPALRSITQWYIANRDSIILPQYTESLDLAGQFNVFTRVARNLDGDTEYVSTIVNDNPMSITSIQNRGGRRIVDLEEIENIADQETLNSYTRRIAINAMSTYSHLKFGSALMPTHGSADTLYCDFPIFDTPQVFSETSWEMDLKYDGVMQHEARRVVNL